MPYYAQLDADGICRTVTHTAGPLSHSANLIEVEGLDESLLGKRRDGKAWVEANQPAPARIITPYALKARMTSAERIGIRTVAKSSAAVEDFQDMLDSARIIDLDDPALAGGLAALEAAGLLAAGRAAEILTAPVQDKERP